MLALPTPNPKKQKYPHIWLDLLPTDTGKRIASFLPLNITDRGTQSKVLPDALSLASVSEVQAKAVGIQTHLSIEHAISPHHTAALIRAWMGVLQDIISIHLPVDVTDTQEVRQVLSLQSIREVSIPNYPIILRQLPKLHFLRSVELRLTRYCPENGQRGLSTGLSTVLRTCPIENLCIICLGCNFCPLLPCFAARLLRPLKVGRQCMTLKSLMFKCTSNHMDSVVKSPTVFPNLEFLHVEHLVSLDHLFHDRPVPIHLSEEIAVCLRGVKNVTIYNCGRVGIFLSALEKNLYGISSMLEVTHTDLSHLGACMNLRSVDLFLKAGTEVWFPQELQTLRSLSLTWDSAKGLDLHEEYYSPTPGIISGIVRRNRDLEELQLKNVTIPCDLLEELLVILASKLITLQLPILHQRETCSWRVLRLGTLLLRYTHNLKNLHLDQNSFRTIAKLRVMMNHEMGMCDANLCVLCDLRKRVESVRDVLTRRYPYFCDAGLQAILFELEPFC